MIEITLKALRFARMSAEQQPTFARDPLIVDIKRREEAFARRPVEERVGHHIQIPVEIADFCGRSLAAFLSVPDRFETDEWDANDRLFMQAVAKSLGQRLIESSAQAL